MTPTAARWLDGLRDFVAHYRIGRPVPTSATPEQRGQRPILATHFSTWIDSTAAELPIAHAIAFTTSDIGIAVVEEFLVQPDSLAASLRPQLIPLREIEYRLYTKDHPDPQRSLHINHWSWIKAPLPPQRFAEFAKWPIQADEAYWLHRTGTSGPAAFECRHAHLWKWTGSHAVLLKPFIEERVSAL